MLHPEKLKKLVDIISVKCISLSKYFTDDVSNDDGPSLWIVVAPQDYAPLVARIFLKTPLREIQLLFETANPILDAAPDLNGAPGQHWPVVRRDPSTGSRLLDLICWGMPFSWPRDGPTTLRVSVRGETVATTSAYRDAFERRRCLVPVDGFCVWRELPDGTKQPHAIRSTDREPLALAGLWDEWRGSAEAVHTFTIITVRANELMAPIDKRMPAILPREEWLGWLGEREASAEMLSAIGGFTPLS